MKAVWILSFFAALSIFGGCASISIGEKEHAEKDKKVREAAELYKSTVWTDRVNAVSDAGIYDTEEAENLLITALSDSHLRVRIEALKRMPAFRDEKAFSSVLAVARDDGDGNIRWTALKVLAVYSRAESAQIFTAAIKDPDWIIREAAYAGYLDIRDERIEKESAEIVLTGITDPNENVRLAVLRHARISDPGIYSELARQIADEKYYQKPTYLKALLSALSNYSFDRETRKAVLVYITHPNADVRVLALRAIRHSDEATDE